MGGVARLLHEALPALRKERNLTQEALARRTAQPGDEGISLATIQGYEKLRGAGTVPELEILDALGRALGVDPAEVFYEYPIAAARRAARPGVSQRRARVKPSESLTEVADRVARRRDDKQPTPAQVPKRKPGKDRAA